jgi:hypothetical protein
MTLDKIEESLYKYLIKEKDETVLSISGEWGIGKTYFWKNIFLDKYKNELKEKKIAYISLFGSDSLNAIRTSILLQSSPSKKKMNWFNEKVTEPFKNLKSSMKIDDEISMSFGLNSLSSLLSLLTSGDFKNVIVCFDDFERMSSKISFKDILGLISELKEQKQCKVVMILNEKELDKLSSVEDEKYSELFNLYKEKIIDLDLFFDPTIDEIFNKKIRESINKFDIELIKSIFESYNIKNIRVIKQIIIELNKFSYILDYLYDKKVLTEFLFSLIGVFIAKIQFGWSPDKYLEEKSKFDPSKMTDEEFNKIFDNGIPNNFFTNIDDTIEKIILDYIKNNKLNKDYLKEILDVKNGSIVRYDLNEKIQNFHYNLLVDFKYTIEKCTNDIYEVFEKHAEDLHNILALDNFHYFINFLKQNGKIIKDDFIDNIIKRYIDKLILQEKSISIHESYKQDFIKENYPYLIKYWNDTKQDELIDNTSLETIDALLNKTISGWGNKDEYVLNNLKEETYLEYIESSSTFTKSIINFILSKRNDKDHFQNAIKNIKRALKNLQERNKDYKFKVDKIIEKTQIKLDI